MKSKVFFEQLTSQSVAIIEEDLNDDLDKVSYFPPIGMKFYSMRQSDRNAITDWVKVIDEFGVALVVGDSKGFTTEYDEDFAKRINTSYSHYSIVGMRSKPEKMVQRLGIRNKLDVDVLCKEHESFVMQKIDRAKNLVKVLRWLMYILLALVCISMGLALYINVLYSLLICLVFYMSMLFVNKFFKRLVDVQLNSLDNFNQNKELFWEKITQKNEILLMEKLYQRMMK